MSKNANQNTKPKPMDHCHKCNKQGHQTHEYLARTKNVPKFEGHYYNYQKYGHRAFECKSKTTWTPNITTQDIAIITIKSMDISLRIALEHTSKETTVDG